MEIPWRRRAGQVVRMSSGCLIGLLCCCLVYEPYNFILQFDFMCLESLQVCVCLIGVSITVEYFFSILSRLWFWAVSKRYRVILFRLWRLFVLILTASAVANAVSLFIQVGDHWTRHMVVSIQILQCVPTLLQVIHSLMQGVYLNLLSGDAPPPQGDIAAMTKHLRSQIRLNFICFVYSLTTGLAIAYTSQSIETCVSVVYMSGEIVYRVYSIYLLKNVKAQYEEDDCFSPARPEKRHDPGKERFVSGRKSRPSTVDTFCQWVF